MCSVSVPSMDTLSSTAVVFTADAILRRAVEALVAETAVLALKTLSFSLLMTKSLPCGTDVISKELESLGSFPFEELRAVKNSTPENVDGSETEEDEDEEDEVADQEDDEGEEEDEEGEEGEDEGDPEDEPEANGEGGSGDEDEEEDDDDDEDGEEGEDEEDEEEEEEEDEDDEEELQPPAKKRK